MTPLPNGLVFSLNYLPIAKNPSLLFPLPYIEPFCQYSQPNKQNKTLVTYNQPNTLNLTSKIYHSLPLQRDPSLDPGGLDPEISKWFDVFLSFGISRSAKSQEPQHNGDTVGEFLSESHHRYPQDLIKPLDSRIFGVLANRVSTTY